MTVPDTEPSEVARQIIQTILLNHPPDLIGATLGDIMARYLHGHQCRPRNQIQEDRMRSDMFAAWSEKVWELVAILDSQEATKQ